ncbi:MAG: hypothetical protein ACRDLS_16870 [Solirubrobacteraceae bacterium]
MAGVDLAVAGVDRAAGKDQMLPMKRWARLRWTSSSSSSCAPSRSRITDADWRGTVAGPCDSASPVADGSIFMRRRA